MLHISYHVLNTSGLVADMQVQHVAYLTSSSILRARWLTCTGPSRWQFELELAAALQALNSAVQAQPDSRHCSCCHPSSALLLLFITPAAIAHYRCCRCSLPLLQVPSPSPGMFRTFKEANGVHPEHIKRGYVPREAGQRLAGSYINHYVANGGVIVPQFGGKQSKSDLEALEVRLEGSCLRACLRCIPYLSSMWPAPLPSSPLLPGTLRLSLLCPCGHCWMQALPHKFASMRCSSCLAHPCSLTSCLLIHCVWCCPAGAAEGLPRP